MNRTRACFQIAAALGLVMLLWASGCSRGSDDFGSVVVYSSVDEIFARPLAERFEEETGIVVRLVPDTE